MTSFVYRKIVNGETLGEKLKEARMEHGLSLEKAARDLNINQKYLAGFENNDLSVFPGSTYFKNFLRQYCSYLHLDFEVCWEAAQKLSFSGKKNFFSLDKKYLFSWPRLIKRVAVLSAIAFVLIFLGFKIQAIFSPPFLEIIQPNQDLITDSRQLEVVGRSEKEAEIVINNQPVFINEEGIFQITVDLQKGLNLIKITAKKRYSKPSEAEIRILLKD